MATMVSLADASPPIALGALDGRYRPAVASLVDHLSEAALNRERIRVEVGWLIHLTTGQIVPNVRTLTADEQTRLLAVVEDFGPRDVAELAELERETAHDVKAVEYYLKRRLTAMDGEPAAGLLAISELIHFACTSEDINNLSYALMIKGAVEQVWPTGYSDSSPGSAARSTSESSTGRPARMAHTLRRYPARTGPRSARRSYNPLACPGTR